MFWFLKSLFCKHEFEFYENLYGDSIIHFNYARSLWVCKKCEKLQKRKSLYKENTND